MPRRHRLRRITKWGGLVLVVLFGAAWFVTGWYWVSVSNGASISVFLTDGACWIIWKTRDALPTAPPVPGRTRFGRAPSVPWGAKEGFDVGREPEQTPSWVHRLRLPRTWLARNRRVPKHANDDLIVPLWLPALLLAIPTAFLFYRDRRRPGPGHCQKCAYDLTGNVSGTCPECGKAV